MEKHRCKLCFKNFSNGRALGGHMRSHMLNLSIAHQTTRVEEEEEQPGANQLSDDTESASSPSSSASEGEAEEEGDEKGVYYGLRENPKRSIRLVDPEFSFAVDVAGSVILQDRESETESSKNPTHRRRSKRTRKFDSHQYHHHQQRRQQMMIIKKLKFNHKLSKTAESWGAPEPEPVSSISDTTTEEDVAFCLMMLSRDKWKRKEKRHQVLKEDQEHEEAEKSMEETDESDEFKSSKQQRSRGKYKCETCKKVFKSYQALGGHRASHKKIKFYSPTQEPELEPENAGTSTPVAQVLDKKIHECPVCFRVFSSGQALGGHKRTHVTGLVATTTPARSSTKLGDNLIDLNLPAPIDDDDISQIELSAVSDAEFVNHIKR